MLDKLFLTKEKFMGGQLKSMTWVNSILTSLS